MVTPKHLHITPNVILSKKSGSQMKLPKVCLTQKNKTPAKIWPEIVNTKV